MSNISQFKSQFRGGVRPNQFRVFMVKGPNGIGTKDFSFLGKAASIPASTMGNVDVPFRGRELKVPGDRIFEDWNLTVFNDGEWSARAYFEKWSQALQGHSNPVRSVGATDVYGTARVQQLGRSGGVIATYTMEDIYPTSVAGIELGFDTNNSVEEFQVTFAVNNWYSSASPEPSTSGSGLDIDFNVRGNIGGVGVSIGTGGLSINT
tara:strand:+ start:113 stop:733 length:621 start_codon:yes stop_codon:yes gene_type:complete